VTKLSVSLRFRCAASDNPHLVHDVAQASMRAAGSTLVLQAIADVVPVGQTCADRAVDAIWSGANFGNGSAAAWSKLMVRLQAVVRRGMGAANAFT
jgi:hypothetical protein